jgi:hypothetical protein
MLFPKVLNKRSLEIIGTYKHFIQRKKLKIIINPQASGFFKKSQSGNEII